MAYTQESSELSQDIVRPLFLIFADSIRTALVPAIGEKSMWYQYSKKDRQIPGNYRPVNLTSILGTFLAGIRDYIQKCIEGKKYKHGLTKGRSCQTKLLTLTTRQDIKITERPKQNNGVGKYMANEV